jgi:hypothetical protein
MRKLRFLQTGASHKAQNPFKSFYEGLGRLAIALCFSAAAFPVFAQCLTESGKIGGRVLMTATIMETWIPGSPGLHLFPSVLSTEKSFSSQCTY